MDASHQALWTRLESLTLDHPDSPLQFSARLARDNGWSRAYARRVVDEYKRFLFLAAAGDRPVCPSEDVDEAWHLHLCYTRSYWHELCRGILGRPLHHEPTRGGGDQLAHHRAMYQHTLAAYRSAFGCDPPGDIWPAVDDRFAAKGPQRRVDSSRHWIVPKPPLGRMARHFVRQIHRLALGVGAASISLLAVANPLDMTGPQFLVFFAILVVAAIIGGRIIRRVFWKDDDGAPLPSVDAYEAALIGGGEKLANRVAVSELVASGAVKIREGKSPALVAVGEAPRGRHPLAGAIYRAIADRDRQGADHKAAFAAGKNILTNLQGRLHEANLLDKEWPIRAYRWAPALLMLAVLGAGLAKISVGIDRGKPVTFLIVLCCIAFVAMLLFLQRAAHTARGQRLLDSMRAQHSDLQAPAIWGARPDSDFVMGLCLFGLAGLATAGDNGSALHRWLFPKGSSVGCTTGTSTGCGGGGGGCGGGGCGGCGGD